MDLIRFMRHELFHQELITEEEYTELLTHSGAVQRLEGYDLIRQQLEAAKAVNDFLVNSSNLANEVNKLLLSGQLELTADRKLRVKQCQAA